MLFLSLLLLHFSWKDWKVVSHLTETGSLIYMQYLHYLKHAILKKTLCSGCGMVTAVCFSSVPSLCIPAMTSTIIIPACSNFILPQTSLSITGVDTKRRNRAHCSEIVQGQIRFEDGSKKLFFFCPQMQFHAAWCTLFVYRTLHFTWQWALGVISFAEPTG